MEILYPIMTFITDMGDSAVLGALVITVSVCLLAQGCRREALVLVCSFIGASLSIALVKILLMGCGSMLHHVGLYSPSGHSALSIAVFGTLAILISERLHGKTRYIPPVILLSLAFLIAMSRVTLGFHSKKEVAVGIIVGVMVLVVVKVSLRRQQFSSFNLYALTYTIITVAFLAHGLHLPAENIIQLIARRFKAYTNCV